MPLALVSRLSHLVVVVLRVGGGESSEQRHKASDKLGARCELHKAGKIECALSSTISIVFVLGETTKRVKKPTATKKYGVQRQKVRFLIVNTAWMLRDVFDSKPPTCCLLLILRTEQLAKRRKPGAKPAGDNTERRVAKKKRFLDCSLEQRHDGASARLRWQKWQARADRVENRLERLRGEEQNVHAKLAVVCSPRVRRFPRLCTIRLNTAK